jgi:flagellar basal body-associated protein FliL
MSVLFIVILIIVALIVAFVALGGIMHICSRNKLQHQDCHIFPMASGDDDDDGGNVP